MVGKDLEKWQLAEIDYMAGLTYKEIAERYGVPLNKIKVWRRQYQWKRELKKDRVPKNSNTRFSKIPWHHIRVDYETGLYSLKQLSEKHSVSLAQIQKHSQEECWIKGLRHKALLEIIWKKVREQVSRTEVELRIEHFKITENIKKLAANEMNEMIKKAKEGYKLDKDNIEALSELQKIIAKAYDAQSKVIGYHEEVETAKFYEKMKQVQDRIEAIKKDTEDDDDDNKTIEVKYV